MRGAPSDLNYRALTDWLTAEENGARPAESSERTVCLCVCVFVWGRCVSSAKCVVLVGGRDVKNTVWNHKSSDSEHRSLCGRHTSKCCSRFPYVRGTNTHTMSLVQEPLMWTGLFLSGTQEWFKRTFINHRFSRFSLRYKMHHKGQFIHRWEYKYYFCGFDYGIRVIWVRL